VLGYSIERPKSLTTAMLEDTAPNRGPRETLAFRGVGAEGPGRAQARRGSPALAALDRLQVGRGGQFGTGNCRCLPADEPEPIRSQPRCRRCGLTITGCMFKNARSPGSRGSEILAAVSY